MKRSPGGQYVIEVMLAIGLFMAFAGALSLLAIDASRTTRAQNQQLKAIVSLQNTTEAIRNIARDDWNALTVGTHGLELQASQWSLSPTTITEQDIIKRITISYISRDASNIINASGTEDQKTKQVDVEIIRASDNKILLSQSLLFPKAFRQMQTWLETTTADFIDGTFSSTTPITLNDGEITLSQGSGTNAGLPFYITLLANTLSISDGNDRVSFRFTSTLASPINEAQIYVSSHTGNSSVYRFGLQADNAGLPSGTYLSSGTFTGNANGWRTVSLSPNVTVAPGTILHLVGQRISGNNSITLRGASPRQDVVASSGSTDTQQQTYRTTDGTTWLTSNLQPIMRITDTSGNAFGNTYTTNTNQAIGGLNEVGQVITLNQATTIDSASFAVSRVGTPPGDLTLSIRDLTTNTLLLQDTFATPGQVTTTTNWIQKNFTAPMTLPANHTIRLELSSLTSTQSNNQYRTPLMSSLATSPFQDTTYGGTSVYATIKTAAVWSANVAADIPFQLHATQGYVTNGTYESSAHDTQSTGTLYGTIVWNAVTPAGTSLVVQTKTASTLAGLATATYVGPDGTASSTYTNGSLIGVDPSATGTQYIQYRMQLSGNGIATPEIQDIHITYE